MSAGMEELSILIPLTSTAALVAATFDGGDGGILFWAAATFDSGGVKSFFLLGSGLGGRRGAGQARLHHTPYGRSLLLLNATAVDAAGGCRTRRRSGYSGGRRNRGEVWASTGGVG